MATSNILPFADTASATDIYDDAQYAADGDQATGNKAGIAKRKLVNKALKQSSKITAAVAQFVADNQATNITDALTVSALVTAITNAISAISSGGTQGAFKNLNASATGTNASVLITADAVVLKSAGGAYKTVTGVNVTINSAATGAANAYDTGVIPANTWLYSYIIWNGTTIAGLLSASATAPTLPSGYTHFALVGVIKTDNTGSKFPLSFIQTGRSWQYKVAAGSNVLNLPIAFSGVAGTATNPPTWVATSISAYAPPIAAKIQGQISNQNSAGSMILAPNNSYGGAGSLTNPPPAISQTTTYQTTNFDFILESANIYYANTSAANGNGWIQGFEINL